MKITRIFVPAAWCAWLWAQVATDANQSYQTRGRPQSHCGEPGSLDRDSTLRH